MARNLKIYRIVGASEVQYNESKCLDSSTEMPSPSSLHIV